MARSDKGGTHNRPDARDDRRTTAGKAREAQRRQDEDRHEAAGLPREHVEADDHPDDDGRP